MPFVFRILYRIHSTLVMMYSIICTNVQSHNRLTFLFVYSASCAATPHINTTNGLVSRAILLHDIFLVTAGCKKDVTVSNTISGGVPKSEHLQASHTSTFARLFDPLIPASFSICGSINNKNFNGRSGTFPVDQCFGFMRLADCR